jgi:hypothetical protein
METATSEVEHVVCTTTLGPRRLSRYDTWVQRWSLSLVTISCMPSRYPRESRLR